MRYQVAFWKPYQGKGAAVITSYDEDRQLFFMKLIPEEGEKNFNNEMAINFKIGDSDLGEIIAVLSGRKNGVGQLKDNEYKGLYHQVKEVGSNTVLNLVRKEEGADGYSLRLSKKKGEKSLARGISLTSGEASLLLEFFRANMRSYFEDRFKSDRQSAPPASAPATKESSTPPKSKKTVTTAPSSDEHPF
jgi:hypothetical protein